MSSRPLVILGVVIIILALIAAGGYLMQSQISGAPVIPAVSIPSNTQYGVSPATSTPSLATTTRGASFPLPAATTTVDTSSWSMHVENELGYSVEYPSLFLTSFHDGVFTLTVPKNQYFHWPLLDDAKISISVSPVCLELDTAERQQSASYSLNGNMFSRAVGTDVGAGNRYLEISDDTKANGSCYRIGLLDHGANGAGFYVDDPSLIGQYDAQHESDIAALVSIYNALVGTFRVLAPAQ
jgi:hypothetical protein